MSLDRRVSLVIPAKNSAGILGRVLDAAMALQNAGEISEILVVDDGSTDKTAEVVARHPVRLLTTGGLGPGGARNVGWRAARHDLVWFIDSDCVAPLAPPPDWWTSSGIPPSAVRAAATTTSCRTPSSDR